jgi:hypothetical protein
MVAHLALWLLSYGFLACGFVAHQGSFVDDSRVSRFVGAPSSISLSIVAHQSNGKSVLLVLLIIFRKEISRTYNCATKTKA